MHTLPKSHAPKAPSGFEAFLRIADRGIPFTAVGGRAFMTVPAMYSGFHTFPIRSRAFRRWFFGQCLSDYDTIPTAQAFSAVLHYLDALAARAPKTLRVRVPYRIAYQGDSSAGKILLDLANSDGEFVEITPHGWQVTSAEGVPFETSSSTCPLPAPEPAGDPDPQLRSPLDILRSTLNLDAGSPDWLRCLAWLLTALRPNAPYPILILRGPSGCGKSVAARILRTLIDPSASPFAPLPSSARELFNLARLNWVLAFDHVSTVSPQIADALCRLTSGLGATCREPGQSEPLQLFIKRPILLTVTDRWIAPPDLAARALTVTFPPRTGATRLSETEIDAMIQAAFPRILGALCTAVAQALASPPRQTSSGTRHAAALAWAEAAAPALNSTPLEMLEAFQPSPPPDPFVDAVRTLIGQTPKWSGTATQLLKLLPLCPTPRALSAQLNESVLALADTGIDLQFRRLPGGERVIDLFASQNLPPPPQPEPETGLISTPELRPPPALCVTTPVGQPGKLCTGYLPAQPAEPVLLASDTIESTPLIDTVPDILARIVAKKRADLAATVQPLEAWEREAELRLPARRDFRAALAARAPAIIAEIKKASPSKGVLSPDFDPPRIARAYESGGAAALSVLTDQAFFQGTLDDLEAARAAVSLPVLRKDFTIDPTQILEAAAHGADAILLIAAILSARQIRDFRETAARHRLSALVEVHNRRELDAAIEAGADLIGVNNRNLSTFEVTLDTSLALAEHMPPGALLVSESGIHDAADIVRLRAAGYHAFLVGEHLMKSGDPAAALRSLVSA